MHDDVSSSGLHRSTKEAKEELDNSDARDLRDVCIIGCGIVIMR